jgi:hypothetical protein
MAKLPGMPKDAYKGIPTSLLMPKVHYRHAKWLKPLKI